MHHSNDGQRTKHHGFGGVEEIKDHKHAGLVSLLTDLSCVTKGNQLLKGKVLNEVEEGGEYN